MPDNGPQTACPIEGCGASKGADKLYCKRHWFMLPGPLRAQIWETWRNRRRGIEPYREAVKEAASYIAGREAPARSQRNLL